MACALYRRVLPREHTPQKGEAASPASPSPKALKSVTGPADSERSGNGGHLVFGRRSARADGGAERVGSARGCRRAPGGARARQARAPAGNPAADARGHAAAALPSPLDGAAEAPRAEPPDRLRPLDSGP